MYSNLSKILSVEGPSIPLLIILRYKVKIKEYIYADQHNLSHAFFSFFEDSLAAPNTSVLVKKTWSMQARKTVPPIIHSFRNLFFLAISDKLTESGCSDSSGSWDQFWCWSMPWLLCIGDRILEVQFIWFWLSQWNSIEPQVSYLLHKSNCTDQHKNWSQHPAESLQPDSMGSSEMAKNKKLRKLWMIGGIVFLACIDRSFFPLKRSCLVLSNDPQRKKRRHD